MLQTLINMNDYISHAKKYFKNYRRDKVNEKVYSFITDKIKGFKKLGPKVCGQKYFK